MRAAAAFLGASLATLLAAAVDAHFADGAAPVPGDELALLLADVGVVTPVGLLLGAVAVVATLTLDLDGLLAALRADVAGPGARPSRGVALAAGQVAGFVALVLLAQAARAVLALDVPARFAGAVLALLAASFAALAVSAARAAGRLAAARGVTVPPRTCLLISTTLVVALGAHGVARGGPNGDQAGVLGVLGVLAREELDLRAPALAALVLACGLVAPVVLAGSGRRSRVFTPRRVLVLAALVPAALLGPLTVRAAGPALDHRAVALSLERGAPLGGLALAVLRKLTDRDRDGVSARFGGGDCDDRDPRVNPSADDVPGNGLDEDCSGSDDALPAPAASAGAAAVEVARDADAGWVRERFPEGLSLLLVTVDTLRADLGYAGNPRPLSPNLDALAKESVVFEHAYSLASYTGKSIGPMLLGKYPSETSRTFDHFDRFGEDETFVQERLAAAGVRTLSAQGHWYFTPEYGLGRGFSSLDTSAAPRVPQAEGDRTVNGDAVTDAALSLLANPDNVSGRFFLWVHYLDPHAMYVPHPEFDFGSKSRDLYDGEVAFTDRHVGRLLDAVRAAPYAARTAVIVTSDHGEAFGEHGLVRHGREVWEELVHVPLIVHVPGLAPRRVTERRSAIDLVPTILELFAVPRPDPGGPGFLSGQSLLPDLRGAAPPARRPVLVDMSEGPYNEERQAFIVDDLKLIASRGRPLGLYDLARDPDEKQDLLSSGPEETTTQVVAQYKAFRRTVRSRPARR